MSNYFTHYWDNKTVEKDKKSGSEGETVYWLYSNQFTKRGVSSGDTVIAISVISGQLHVLCALDVFDVLQRESIAKLYNLPIEDTPPMEDHVVAGWSTHLKFDIIVPIERVACLEFITQAGPQAPLIHGNELDRQTMRGIRQLTEESGEMLLQYLGEFFITKYGKAMELDQNHMPEEVWPQRSDYMEGSVRQVTVNAYERNATACRKCIEHFGATCHVCGFDFGETYGEPGKGYIHVHHLIPLADISESYQVDPIHDLRPVCPNCHAMIHIDDPPVTIDELKEMFRKA